MGDNNVIVIGSDEEDEKALWKTNGTDDHFQRLFKKVKRIIFNRTKRSYITKGFPYGRFVEFAQELETALATVPSKNTQRFIWRCVVRWLVPLKNCIREPIPLFDDWKYNYIVTDIMTQYINFKCEYYHERDKAVVKEQVEEIIRMLEVAFSCKTEFVLITFLKIKIRYEYRNILIPLFRAYLISPFDYDANDFCKYICLVLCYRQWKRLIRTKESRETVNEYACGQSERLMGTYRPIDLTLNPVLPWEVPSATRRSEIFFKLHPHLTTAREMKNGTRLLLASVWRDWSFILRKFIRLYEEYNGFSVRLEPEVPSVKQRDEDVDSDDDVILIPNDDVIVINDDDDLPSAGGSISDMDHLRIVEKLKRLAEDTPPKSAEEQEDTEKALQNLQCRCGTGKQGTTMAVNQHLSKVCDISSLSKTLGFSSLRSLSIQISVYLSLFKNEKRGNCNCRYLGSSFNENNVCIVLDTTDKDCDDDDNYFVRDEVTDKIGDDFTINDLVDKELFGKDAEIAKQPPAAVASAIAELKRRALEMGPRIQNRRPETPIVLSSDDEEPVVVQPPAAVQEVNQNDVIIAEIVLSSSEDEAPAAEREIMSPRRTPPPVDVEERPLRREKTRCITGEVSSTTSLDCSGTPNADNALIQNENVLENAREVGTLSVVRTSSPSGNGPSVADYSDISDDDLDICLAPRQRWSKFAKVVEEATSSTSELPIRDESETRSDNVIFSVPCNRRRRSNSSSPCHTRANSPSDNSRLISPSSTFRTRRVRRYRARHFSRIPVRRFRTVTRAIDDSDLPTCSRYLRRISRHPNGVLENRKNPTDSPSNEKAICSRNVQKKSVKQGVEGGKENSEEPPIAAKSTENVNEEQTPPISENVNPDLNKLMEDISKFIDSPVHSKAKTDCGLAKPADEASEQILCVDVSSKGSEVPLVHQIVPHSEGCVELEPSEEGAIDKSTSTNACSSKDRGENAFIDPVSEHSYFSKMHKSATDTVQENANDEESENVTQMSELSLTENLEHNKSQCSISAQDHERMFDMTLNNDLTYLRKERRDSLERSPLSSVENDFLVEDELSSYELDNDDDIESPAYEPIIPKNPDKANDELVLEDKRTVQDVTASNDSKNTTKEEADNNDLLNVVPVAIDSSDSSKEKQQDVQCQDKEGAVLVVGEHSPKQTVGDNDTSTHESIAINKNDLAATRLSEQMHDLNRDEPPENSNCTLMTNKAPIDAGASLDVAISDNVIPTESSVNEDDTRNPLLERNKSTTSLPAPLSDILSMTESPIECLTLDATVVCERPSSEMGINEVQIKETQSSLAKDIDRAIQRGAQKCQSNVQDPSLASSKVVPTVALNQSESDEGVGETNEHEKVRDVEKSVSEHVAKSSQKLNESFLETDACEKPEVSPAPLLTEDSTLSKACSEKSALVLADHSPRAFVEISVEENEGTRENVSNLSNNESVSTVASTDIPSFEEEDGDKEEQESNEASIGQSPSESETSSVSVGVSGSTDLLAGKGPAGGDHTPSVLENQKRCTSPKHVGVSPSSEEKGNDVVPTSVETGDQIMEQKRVEESSVENESAERPLSIDSAHVGEVGLQEKFDENNLSESVPIINDSVKTLPSVPSSVEEMECKAAPDQETESTKQETKQLNIAVPAVGVSDETKCDAEEHDDEKQRSLHKPEVDEATANETAPADVDVEAKKESLLIQKSGSESDVKSDFIQNVEMLSTSDTSSSNCDVSEQEEASKTDPLTDVENIAPSDVQTKQDETLPLEDIETSPTQGRSEENTETETDMSSTNAPEEPAVEGSEQVVPTASGNINLNVSTESQRNEVSREEKVVVETEVSPEQPAVPLQPNDISIENEIQLGSEETSNPLRDDEHQDTPQNKETIEDHPVPTPSDDPINPESNSSSEKVLSEGERVSVEIESNHREVVQTLASVAENSSSAELTVASLGNEVEVISNESIQNEIDQIPGPPDEGDTLMDNEKHAKNDDSDTLTEKDRLSTDDSVTRSEDNFSENIPDTELTDTSPHDTTVEDRSQTVSKDKSPPHVTVPREIQPQTAIEVNLDAPIGLSEPPRVDHEFIRNQAKNSEAPNDDFVSSNSVALVTSHVQDPVGSPSKELTPVTNCPPTNGLRDEFVAEDLSANVEAAKCQDPHPAHDHRVQNQGKRHVFRAAKQLLSIEDYAMVKSFQKVTPRLAEPCNAHVTTVSQAHNLVRDEVVDKIQTLPQNGPRPCPEQHKYNTPADYSTTSPTVIFSNPSATRDNIGYKRKPRSRKVTANPVNSSEKRSPMFEAEPIKAHHLRNKLRPITAIEIERNNQANMNILALTQQLRDSTFAGTYSIPNVLNAMNAKLMESKRPPNDLSQYVPRNANMCMPTESDLCARCCFSDRCCAPKMIPNGFAYPSMPFRGQEPPYKPNSLPVPSVPFVNQRTEKDNFQNFTWPKAIAGISKTRQLQLSQPKPQRVPADSYHCIDYSKQTESLRPMPTNRNSNEGQSSLRREMRVDSSAEGGNAPSLNADIQFLLKVRQKRSLDTGDDSNQSIQVEVAAEDLGDTLSSFDSGTGYNSPAYGFETPYRENSKDCSSSAVTQPPEDLEDQEVSAITSQEVAPTPYSAYNDDCGTPVMDEKDAEDADGSPCQGKIVSLSVLKQIPELPSLVSVPTHPTMNVNKFQGDTSPYVCLDASKNCIPIDMTSAPKDAGPVCESRPLVNSNSGFIEPSPKPKPAIDIDSEYQKTPLKMRIKRRISQCADINEAFNLGPSESLKPIDILATQALERQHNESVIESAGDSVNHSICNYPTDLSLKGTDNTPEQEKDQNLLYQESWYKKLGKTKTIDRTPHRQHPNPMGLSNSQCTSDNSDALAMLQLSGSLNASSSVEDTPLSAKNEGRRRKPIRVRKLADIYDRDNIANEPDMPASVYPLQPTMSARHSLFTYPAAVGQPQPAVETTMPLQPISVLETAYNPEDIKAATILSDMLKTSYKIDESLKYRSPKTPKARKTTSPRSNKQASLQFRRMTRSTSHLMDKAPFIGPTNTLQLILPTTSPRMPCAQDSPPVAENLCTNSIWQQDKTKEILRSLTAPTSLETGNPIPCQSSQKSNSLSNTSSDSDDVGKLVIDLDHKRGAGAGKKSAPRSAAIYPSICALDQTTGGIPTAGEILDMTNVYLSKGAVKRNINSAYKLTPDTGLAPRLQRHSVDKPEFDVSPEYDVSALYPIVQLTEFTPKSKPKRGPRRHNQPRSYVRQNGRRILNSPKPTAEKQNTRVGRTAKSRKSPASRAVPKADALNDKQALTEAKTPTESSSELSTSDNSPSETPDKILPFSVEAILRGCKSSEQKPTPEADSPSTPPEMATTSQEYWLKAFLLMRKSTEAVSSEPKEQPILAPSLHSPVSEALPVEDLKATAPEAAGKSADKTHRRKKSLLPTRKLPKSLIDTAVYKSEKESSAAKDKPKTVQPKANRRKYNRTVKAIISTDASLESESTKQNNEDSPEIPKEQAAAKETDSSASKITPAALSDPAPTPSVEKPLLVCQKIRKSKSVEDIVARLSKTVRKSKLRLSIEPGLPESTPASGEVSPQQEPRESDCVFNCEPPQSLKVSLQLSAIAGENKNCETPDLSVECIGNIQQWVRRKSEKMQSLEVIVEDKMETQLNEDQTTKPIENDSCEMSTITIEADKPRSRRNSIKEVENKQPEQSENSPITEQTSQVIADKPKRGRSSNKKIENNPIESKEEDKSDGKSVTNGHKKKTKLYPSSDEQSSDQKETEEQPSLVDADKPKRRQSSNKKTENNPIESKEEEKSDEKSVTTGYKKKTKICSSDEQSSDQKETEEKPPGRDDPVEIDSSEEAAIQPIPVEADKLRNRRKSVKELEGKDIESMTPDQSPTAEQPSPVDADKPKRRRSSNKKIENKAMKEDAKSVTTGPKKKTKPSQNSDEQIENTDMDQKEPDSQKEEAQDEVGEVESSEVIAIPPIPAVEGKSMNRRKSQKEFESKDIDAKEPAQAIAEDAHPVVDDKPKRRRSSNKKIESKPIEAKKEDTFAGKSVTKTKTKLNPNSEEQIGNSDQTESPKEDQTPEPDEPVDQSNPLEADKPRTRQKSLKELECKEIESKQIEITAKTGPPSPVVADKPKRRRSSNKKLDHKVIEAKEEARPAGKSTRKNKTKLCHDSDEQTENSDSDQKEAESQKEEGREESEENDSSGTTAIQPEPVETDKPRTRRKSHKERECKEIDSQQPDKSSTAEPTSPVVADKPKRRRSSNKKLVAEAKEEEKSATKIKTKLCRNSDEQIENSDQTRSPPEDMAQMSQDPEATQKTTPPEVDNAHLSEIPTEESVEAPPTPVAADKPKAGVCKSTSMPNVEVEKCHLKRKCIMQIRRLSIDENNLKMTLSKSKEIVEKHSKHAKKHSKRARRFSAEICDIIRRNEETERRLKAHAGLCNDDKVFKLIKSKRTEDTGSRAKSTSPSKDDVGACDNPSIAESKTDPLTVDTEGSTDDEDSNLDVSHKDGQEGVDPKEAEGTDKPKTNRVKKIKLSSVDERPVKVDEEPPKNRKSMKSHKRPAPRSQKAKEKSKRRRVEEVTSSDSEENEIIDTKSAEASPATDNTLGVFKIVRSTVAQGHKPAPKSRKRLNSQHTTDRRRLVVLLRSTKAVKRTPEEACNSKTVQPKQTNSGKNIQRRSLDCDNSRANSDISLRLRSKSTDMKRSPSSDQQSRKLKPFKLNISKLEACHKTLKEMNSTEPTTRYEAKLYDESERLAEQLNSFIKKILEDSEDSSSMLLTSRPQVFDRVPKDIFAGNGDVSDNIETQHKYYSPILPPKPYDIILKSKSSEDANLNAKAVDEKEKIKPRSDADDQESENEDAENGNNSDGNTAPDLELDASEMPHIPDVGIICDDDSIPDLSAEAECLSEVLDEKINKEVLDANIDTSTPFIRDYMISGNYRSNNYLDLLPEFEGISLLGVQNQFQNDNSDGDGLLVPKVENLADVEIDFGSELFLYSGCIQSQDSSGSSDEKREQECETPTPPVDAYLNSASPSQTVAETPVNHSEIVNEVVAEEVIQDTSSPQNQSPPVEVSSEVGFESYNELLAESNPFFLPSALKDEQSNESETQPDKETDSPNTAEDILENSIKENEAPSVDSGNSALAGDSVVDTKEVPAKTKRDRIKVLPIESLKPEIREEICAPVKLKSRPIPFWKIKKIENKSDSGAQSKEIPQSATPTVSERTEFSFAVGPPVEGVETIVVTSESCEVVNKASPPSEKPLQGVTDAVAAQLIKIPQLPEFNELVEDKTPLDACASTTQISQLPELDDTVVAQLESTPISQLPELNDTVQDNQTESTQISHLPELKNVVNNKPDFDHTYTSTQKIQVPSDKLPELNEIPEKYSSNSKPPTSTVQKCSESNRIPDNKHNPSTKHTYYNLSKKTRSDTPNKLSKDDLFDRLKRESPVNPLMHKIKYTLQKTASFDTDDNSSRDSCIGLLTVPQSPHPVISNAPSPATFACESPLPIIAPSMPIISTPSRHDSCPEGNTKTADATKPSKPLRMAKSSPGLDLHSTESEATYIAPSTSKDLKRSHGKVECKAPEEPPRKIPMKATDNVDKLEHVQSSTEKTHKTDKNLERLKKPSAIPVSSPRPDVKPIQRVHFSSEIIEIPKVDLLLSASKEKTESPRPVPKPMKSILVSPSKHSGSQSSDSSRRGRYRISENNSLDHSSPMSDGYSTNSHSQRVNSRSSSYHSSRADKSATPRPSQSSRSHYSQADLAENNKHKKLPTTSSTHSRSSSSSETKMLIASLTAEIKSISNILNRLPEPDTYAQHNYRKHTRELYEQKRQHLHELMKGRYKETERHSQAQSRSKSYSERQPIDNSSNYKSSAQSSQRETKEKSKDRYKNKFGELGTKHFPIVDINDSRVGTCRETKLSSSWDLKQVSVDEIIADLKKSRRN